MEAKTTLTYRGIEYPFYRTNRGQWDFEAAGFTNQDILKNKQSAMLALTFFMVRACAVRAGMPFVDTLDDFVDNTDPDVINVFDRLQQENKKREEAPGKLQAKPTPRVAPKPQTKADTEMKAN
jgi:hypothetical protein